MLEARKFRNMCVNVPSYFDKNITVDSHVYVFNNFYSSKKYHCMLNHTIPGAFLDTGK